MRSLVFGDLRDSRWAGVRTCFQLPAVLTTPANPASPSEVTNLGSAPRRAARRRASAHAAAFAPFGVHSHRLIGLAPLVTASALPSFICHAAPDA
jgi:hypothetical protein